MRVRYTPRAAADLDAIYEYIDQRSPAAALTVKRFIKEKIDSLADFPFVAPASDELDVFELPPVGLEWVF